VKETIKKTAAGQPFSGQGKLLSGGDEQTPSKVKNSI